MTTEPIHLLPKVKCDSYIIVCSKFSTWNCIIPAFAHFPGQLPRGLYARSMPSIKWYHRVRNDDVIWKTEQPPHLSATVQARRLSLFSHIVQMSDESDAKQILTASPLENWRRPPGRPYTTWMKTTQQDLKSMNLPWMKQSTWLKIIHSGDWCLCLALRTHSGACQKWMNEWIHQISMVSVIYTVMPLLYGLCVAAQWRVLSILICKILYKYVSVIVHFLNLFICG